MTKKEKEKLFKNSYFVFKNVNGNQVKAVFLDFYESQTGEKLLKLQAQDNNIYLVKEKEMNKKWKLKSKGRKKNES